MDPKKQSDSQVGRTSDPASQGDLAANSSVDDFFKRLQPEMRRPLPSQDAIASALQAMQRLAAESAATGMNSSEAGVSNLPMSTCGTCGHQNRPGSQFCGMCGLALNLDEPLLEDQPIPGPVDSPAAMPPGQHHYHHHYHHHYFVSGGEFPLATGGGPVKGVVADSSLRDARLRAPGASQTMSRTEAAVRKVTFDWALACNNKQLDDLVSTYSGDALVLRPNHPPVRGTAAIREYFFSVLDAGLGEVQLEPLRVDIVGEVAYEAGRCKMLVPVVVGKRREERGKYLTMLSRQANGEWRIVADCWSSDLSLTSSNEADAPKPGAPGTSPQKNPVPRKGP